MTNTMGGTYLYRPPSFQHVMIHQNTSQQVEPWTQMPQVPQLSIPWSIQNLQQPEIIRFTGEQTCMLPSVHHKRKLETSDLIDMRQTKQFITEEKMAAHFQDLHISSTYHLQNQVFCNSTASVPSEKPNIELDIDTTVVEPDNTKTPKLVFSEELKRLQHEPILPSSLLSKLERPSMALVLWEPPSKHLRIFPARDTPTPIPSTSDDNNNSSNNNNNNNNIIIGENNNSEGIPNLNQSTIGMSFEPMEL